MTFQVGGRRFVADVDADFAQRHPRVERDQRTVTCVGCDARRRDHNFVVEAERVEFAAQDMFGHHAARGVGGANKQDGTKARLTRSRAFKFGISGQKIYTPPPITSPMLSFLVTPLASSSLSLAPSSAGSHIEPFFETLAPVCHPRIIHTFPNPPRTTSPSP